MLTKGVLAKLVLQDGTVLHFTETWEWQLVSGTLPKLPPVRINELYSDWPGYVDMAAGKLKPKQVLKQKLDAPEGELGKDFVY